MKLSHEGRCELRKQVEYLLETVPYGKKIKLEKELLEQLLFEKKQMVPEQYFKTTEQFLAEGFAKVPIWSGPFLRKIDLSKVSFENVTWCVSGYPDLFKELQAIYNFNGIIDYSYTNVNIDFSSSFEAKDDLLFCGKVMFIRNCNFIGVDLSNNDIETAMIIDSNVSHTNINLKNVDLDCYNSNFTGVNLANHNVYINVFLSEYFCGDLHIGEKGNFLNTKLNIVGSVDHLSEKQKKLFYTLIKNGRLNGCYLNGKLITGLEWIQGTHVRKNIEYENMKDDFFASITKSIEEQKKSFRR